MSEATEEDLALLPRMVTDITLRHADHTIIVDAKFYRKALVQGRYGERVRSQHLYQLVTYLQNERMRQADKNLSGMLIYPDVGRSLRLRYRLLGLPVLVATVDLGRDWPDIEVELHALLDDCAGAASRTRSLWRSAEEAEEDSPSIPTRADKFPSTCFMGRALFLRALSFDIGLSPDVAGAAFLEALNARLVLR